MFVTAAPSHCAVWARQRVLRVVPISNLPHGIQMETHLPTAGRTPSSAHLVQKGMLV